MNKYIKISGLIIALVVIALNFHAVQAMFNGNASKGQETAATAQQKNTDNAAISNTSNNTSNNTVATSAAVHSSPDSSDSSNNNSSQLPAVAVLAQEQHVPVCPGPAAKGDVRCHSRVVVDASGSPKAATLPSGYGPLQFHAAYAAATTTSSNQIIGIVDAYDDPAILSDLNTYSTTFGIPTMSACIGSAAASTTPCFKKVNQQGGASYPSSNAGWALETSLDVETAHAMCQNCTIVLVEANSANLADLMTAEDQAVAQGATVISNSYGANEFSGEVSLDSHFNHPGIAITVSSGDSGYGVEYPAASPYVTAVGGTTLTLNTNNSYKNESVWSGAGSGCSAYESKAVWQTDSGCIKRTVADVSADADPNSGAAVYDSVRYQGKKGWFKVGGTSLASPLIAGIYALAGGVPAGAQGNSLPYLQTVSLHDILTGNNGTCGSYLCMATAGYDGPTGLGTPNGTGAF